MTHTMNFIFPSYPLFTPWRTQIPSQVLRTHTSVTYVICDIWCLFLSRLTFCSIFLSQLVTCTCICGNPSAAIFDVISVAVCKCFRIMSKLECVQLTCALIPKLKLDKAVGEANSGRQWQHTRAYPTHSLALAWHHACVNPGIFSEPAAASLIVDIYERKFLYVWMSRRLTPPYTYNALGYTIRVQDEYRA